MASFKKAVARIVADPASSRRHWLEVAQNAEARAKNPAWNLKSRDRSAREAEIARAAVAMIDRIGIAPKSLVLDEAAEELGFLP